MQLFLISKIEPVKGWTSNPKGFEFNKSSIQKQKNPRQYELQESQDCRLKQKGYVTCSCKLLESYGFPCLRLICPISKED
jgi:hypothetical protein